MGGEDAHKMKLLRLALTTPNPPDTYQHQDLTASRCRWSRAQTHYTEDYCIHTDICASGKGTRARWKETSTPMDCVFPTCKFCGKGRKTAGKIGNAGVIMLSNNHPEYFELKRISSYYKLRETAGLTSGGPMNPDCLV
ncbi:hypothetical protein OIU84_023320 [Salix udensis]|uniref:Uncharacterized protein n=1 Tax=Salix udensis TaxID=889485 RepID=A0AAD6KR25_9ROSI|nr:hypothetical protein OIU84_023320 [Salix udensis]